MFGFFIYGLVLLLIIVFLFRISEFIIDNKPKWRPFLAIIFSLITAFCASFVCDIIFQYIFEKLIFSSILIPLFSWLSIAWSFFYLTKNIATKNIQISMGFFIIGLVAILASFIGNSYNIYVGIVVIIFGLVFQFNKSNNTEMYN